ncbi:MAG: DUF1641 domain-containing protein [Desulfurococcales archaeon]|nr:DUF1641 domain-containing protein [Desulfurococcales archaeon]
MSTVEQRLERLEERLDNLARSVEELQAAIDSLIRALARMLESDSTAWALRSLASCSEAAYKALSSAGEAGAADLVRALGDPSFRRGLGALIGGIKALGTCLERPGE